MRRFSSYGPINNKLHYYAPREELINRAYIQLMGENPPEGGNVIPEFPTGNGKIDLIITYAGEQYGLEVKSYSTRGNYSHALVQAAQYGKQLGLSEIFFVFFVDAIDEENRGRYEKDYPDEATGVKVVPIFVETGPAGE